MVYRQDNRRKSHRVRYTILGIVIGVFLVGGGIYVYDNYKKSILDGVKKIDNNIIIQYGKSNQIVKSIVDIPKTTKSDNMDSSPIITQQTIKSADFSLKELKKITLDDINNYRSQYGIPVIIEDDAKASQLWAEHLLNEGCISHREGQIGPIQRYVNSGDKLQMVFENVSGGYGASYMSPDSSLKQANEDMMNNDIDQNNAHRNNILNPNHNSVSLGIAYNDNKLILVEDFQEPISITWKSYDMSYDDSKSCW